MEKEFKHLIEDAKNLCVLIEQLDLSDTSQLQASLAALFSDMCYLLRVPIEVDDFEPDAVVELPTALSNISDKITFFVIFDPLDEKSVHALTLKNSLIQIYKALKLGLQIMDQSPEKEMSIMWEWKFGFQFHWGRHMIDIIRFFHLCSNVNDKKV